LSQDSQSEPGESNQFHRKIRNLAFSESDSGSSTNSNKNLVVFGQATHVGCGWIQFPTSTSTKDSKVEDFFMLLEIINQGFILYLYL